MLQFKHDYVEARSRIQAWWECQVIDRALTAITFRRPKAERLPLPEKQHATPRERWLDVEFQAEIAYIETANTVYYADAIPVQCPYFGPDLFAAFFGCEIELPMNGIPHAVPVLQDWTTDDIDAVDFQEDNFYYKKALEMLEAYVRRARGKFIVGYPELRAGGDTLAAFRDGPTLAMDLVTNQGEVIELLKQTTDDFLLVYNSFHEYLSDEGMPSSTWIPLTCSGRFHVASCDFSALLAEKDFQDFFLPEIVRECQYMDNTIYNLFGADALKHLDAILEVPEIHAIQWVPGAIGGNWRQWIDVYKRIQKKKKAYVVLGLLPNDLDEFMTHLHPEGACLRIGGVHDEDEAENLLRKIERWK